MKTQTHSSIQKNPGALARLIVGGVIAMMVLAACGSPRSQAPSPASLLDAGSFRITMGNQVFTDVVVVSQGQQDDTLITMTFDEGRIEMVFPSDMEPGAYRGCRMAMYDTGQCVDPLGMRFVRVEDEAESESDDYADLALTLESTSPPSGSFRIAPNDGPIVEGVFRAP